MQSKISTAAARVRLPRSASPVFHKIAQGKHLGFRTSSRTWIARHHPAGEKRLYEPLGSEAELDFEQALAKAMDWFDKANGPSPPQASLAQALSAYLTYLHDERSPTTYQTSKSCLERHVFPQLGSRRIADLKTADYEDWLRKLANRLASESQETDQAERRRKAKYMANHVLGLLKAALNRAFNSNRALPKDEWSFTKDLSGGKAGKRDVFLTGNEPQRLVNACEGAFRDLVTFGLMTGCRPGEARNMRVRDFDPEFEHWDVSHSKTGPRTCVLDQDAVALLTRVCAGKAKTDLVFTPAPGRVWNNTSISQAMKLARAKAKLDPETCYYSLRHSYISSQLKAGVPTQIVAENVGTSVTMIEKHYGKFLPSEKRAWLARGKIELEVPESKVVVLR